MYREYSQDLYNYIFWLVENRDECNDIFQSFFTKLWQISHIPCERGKEKPWLIRVARNACLDFFRARKRRRNFHTVYGRQPRSHAKNDYEDTLIWQGLHILGEVEKSIIYLHVKKGYPYKEIAEMLNLTENNVRIKAFRAFKRLRTVYTESV